MDNGSIRVTEEEALQFHSQGRPGKIEISATKALTTQRDLSLAYSPGVAFPCLAIQKDPATAYDYTAKGNMVAVISNGTAVLGLGNLGALGAKPVMEGKAVLFKRFAGIDSFDLEIDTADVDAFVNCVRYLHPCFGGINLEDIKAPDCFIIEQRLRELLDIPVFHDDQHGTAIIATAGLINALHLTGRDMKNFKMVVNGAGAASIACVELLKTMGMPHENCLLVDTKGVVYEGRTEGMNQWKSAHAVRTKARTLAEAMEGADVFYGLSVKGAVDQKMVKSMAEKPIVFAMANPDPEITPEECREARPDAIIATGRSDYPNQINNVLGFPYIFRGALDVRASTINDAMKIAAAEALAALAREDVPDEVAAAYSGRRLKFGPEYLIPTPFDPRLIYAVPTAVAKAAMETKVARKPITDMAGYSANLKARLDPMSASLQLVFDQVRAKPKRVVFAEGEEEKVIRAAIAFHNSGSGTAILVGFEQRIRETMASIGSAVPEGIIVQPMREARRNPDYVDFLYKRLQRRGVLRRDVQRMINQNRNVFAATMVATGDADAVVTGTTRSWATCLDDMTRVLSAKPGARLFGLNILLARGHTVFISDTMVHELPTPEELADIAVQTAAKVRQMGHEPRVAFVSFSNFGNPMREKAQRIRDAVAILDGRRLDFEYEGELSADLAVNYPMLKELYPFARLSGAANVLIMPALHTANASAKLLKELGGGTMVGPLLIGLEKPVQIVEMGATVSDLVNLAAIAAHDAVE
jgi:malate dehydrogenase (oxaloacetate-decarboxylating)(NADP+)